MSMSTTARQEVGFERTSTGKCDSWLILVTNLLSSHPAMSIVSNTAPAGGAFSG